MKRIATNRKMPLLIKLFIILVILKDGKREVAIQNESLYIVYNNKIGSFKYGFRVLDSN